ncbi:MAG: tetratricopeptide repeat protein [Bdellovibrionales bacterium]
MGAILVAFYPALGGGFIWDDFTYLIQSELVRAPDGLRRIWLTQEGVDFWPLSYSLFFLEWRIWGENPLGYHGVNLLLHFLNSLLIWRILVRLGFRFAFLSALLFAVHPLSVDAVAWIIQTKTTFASLLALLSIDLYLVYRDRRRASILVASLLAFAGSLLAKTAFVMLPVGLVAFEFFARTRDERVPWRSRLYAPLPFFALSSGIGTIALNWYPKLPLVEMSGRGFLVKIADAAYLIFFYATKAVAPLALSFAYEDWKDFELGSPLVLRGAALAGLLILSGLALFYRHSRQVRLSVACGVGFAIMLFPVLGFIEIYFMRYSMASDHWQYPVYVLLLIPVVSIVGDLCRTFVRMSLVRVLAIAAVAALMSLSFRHSRIYRSEEFVWKDVLIKYPNSSLAHNNLGLLMERQGKVEEARKHYEAVLSRDPNDVEANVNVGAYFVNKSQVERAIPHLQRALLRNPDSTDGTYNLGVAYFKLNQYTISIPYFEMAIKLNPRFLPARNNLGIALRRTGRLKEARLVFEEALNLDRTDGKLHFNYAGVLEELGHPDRAAVHYKEAARLLPGHPAAKQKLDSLTITPPNKGD